MRRVLLVAVVLLSACGSPLGLGFDADALMVTDSATYQLTPRLNGVEAIIGYTYSNRTGKTVSIPNCHGDVTPHLEKLIEDEWVVAWSAPKLSCLSAPVTISPGELYRDEVRLFSGAPGSNVHPQFTVAPIEGRYRLVWGAAVWAYDASGPPWGGEIPLHQRVSNGFELIEP